MFHNIDISPGSACFIDLSTPSSNRKLPRNYQGLPTKVKPALVGKLMVCNSAKELKEFLLKTNPEDVNPSLQG